MNKRYEEGRKPLFSASGETQRKQYVWAKDKEGKEYLQETESIDIQGEIESYADECDIKNIVRKASFDPQFMQSLSQGALDGSRHHRISAEHSRVSSHGSDRTGKRHET